MQGINGIERSIHEAYEAERERRERAEAEVLQLRIALQKALGIIERGQHDAVETIQQALRGF